MSDRDSANASFTEISNGVSTVTSAAIGADGSVNLNVTTDNRGALHSDSISVSPNGEVRGNDAWLRSGVNAMPGDVVREFNGGEVNHALAQQIREAAKGFLNDGVIDAKEAGQIGQLIDRVQNDLPMPETTARPQSGRY